MADQPTTSPSSASPTPIIPATDEHPAIYRDGHRLTATPHMRMPCGKCGPTEHRLFGTVWRCSECGDISHINAADYGKHPELLNTPIGPPSSVATDDISRLKLFHQAVDEFSNIRGLKGDSFCTSVLLLLGAFRKGYELRPVVERERCMLRRPAVVPSPASTELSEPTVYDEILAIPPERHRYVVTRELIQLSQREDLPKSVRAVIRQNADIINAMFVQYDRADPNAPPEPEPT